MRVEIEAELVVVAEEDIASGSQIIINKGAIVAVVLPRRARRPLAIETDYIESVPGAAAEQIADWDDISDVTEEAVPERRPRGRPRGSTKKPNPFAPNVEGEPVPPEAWGAPEAERPVRPIRRDDIIEALQTRPLTTRQLGDLFQKQGLTGGPKDMLKRLKDAGLVVPVSEDRFPLYGLLGAEYPDGDWAEANEALKAAKPAGKAPSRSHKKSWLGPIRGALADRKALTVQDLAAALGLKIGSPDWRSFNGTIGIMVGRSLLKKIELNGVTLMTLPDGVEETAAAEETAETET